MCVRFPIAVFPLEAVKKAAYRVSADCAVDIQLDGGEIVCRLLLSSATTLEERDELERRFRTEVLDQDLRSLIAAETQSIRNVVLAHAFSRTGLQDGE